MAGEKSGDNNGALDYAREAAREWGNAARYGAKALAARRRENKEDRPSLHERLSPATTDKGGRLGDAADSALARMGKPGKLASKLSMGSRVVERIRPGSNGDENEDGGADGDERDEADRSAPDSDGSMAPVEAAVDIAVPIEAVYEIGTRFEDYPNYLERVVGVEELDEDRLDVVAKVRRRHRELAVEIVEELPGRRIEWECGEGVPHSGVVSLHELAPTLTHVELTVEFEPGGLFGRLAYSTRATQRAAARELERFKAYAELSDEGAEAFETASEQAEREQEPEDDKDYDEPEAAADEDELADEDYEEGPVDEEEPVDEEDLDEDDFEEDEELEDEELEPVRSGR
jgi:uncharacterized membrane protein